MANRTRERIASWHEKKNMVAIWVLPEDHNVIKSRAKARKMSKTRYIEYLLNRFRAEL